MPTTVTLATLMDMTRRWADAVATDRWDDDTEVKPVLGIVYEEEWSRILAAAPTYRTGTRSVTTSATGRVALSDLDSGSGDSLQRWHRILAVVNNQTVYEEIQARDYPLVVAGGGVSARDHVTGSYILVGDELFLPGVPSTAISVMVNHKPQAIEDLADTSSLVTFPLGGHIIIAMEAAAMLLQKGGTESTAARDLVEMASVRRESMLSDLQRRTAYPVFMGTTDAASDWHA